ncbi:hypothetical protein BZA05DRAFT_468697 [Tricharina praecox]|uniref:uncharacterized protein n=1 Tax=Tricharina praecox TaxID=43433 RepID=UPI00221FE962|nr:uncharacterized protein BZA05DRAFT_468697 [Tricharina praecox]KAI5854024.1 hypothetical protein BZA05DRAFT_468697 [Tricharina praecox]
MVSEANSVDCGGDSGRGTVSPLGSGWVEKEDENEGIYPLLVLICGLHRPPPFPCKAALIDRASSQPPLSVSSCTKRPHRRYHRISRTEILPNLLRVLLCSPMSGNRYSADLLTEENDHLINELLSTSAVSPAIAAMSYLANGGRPRSPALGQWLNNPPSHAVQPSSTTAFTSMMHHQPSISEAVRADYQRHHLLARHQREHQQQQIFQLAQQQQHEQQMQAQHAQSQSQQSQQPRQSQRQPSLVIAQAPPHEDASTGTSPNAVTFQTEYLVEIGLPQWPLVNLIYYPNGSVHVLCGNEGKGMFTATRASLRPVTPEVRCKVTTQSQVTQILRRGPRGEEEIEYSSCGGYGALLVEDPCHGTVSAEDMEGANTIRRDACGSVDTTTPTITTRTIVMPFDAAIPPATEAADRDLSELRMRMREARNSCMTSIDTDRANPDYNLNLAQEPAPRRRTTTPAAAKRAQAQSQSQRAVFQIKTKLPGQSPAAAAAPAATAAGAKRKSPPKRKLIPRNTKKLRSASAEAEAEAGVKTVLSVSTADDETEEDERVKEVE